VPLKKKSTSALSFDLACNHSISQLSLFHNFVVMNPATSPAAISSQCQGLTVCKASDIRLMLDKFRYYLKMYDDAQSNCENATKLCTSFEAKCPPTATPPEFGNTSKCESQQLQIESSYCTLATTVEQQWSSYDSCYMQKSAALNASQATQRVLENGRQQSWKGLLRILCLIGALEASDTESVLNFCINQTLGPDNWRHLFLVYPTLGPEKQCTQTLAVPGTDAYNYLYYTARGIPGSSSSLLTSTCSTGLTTFCPRSASPASASAIFSPITTTPATTTISVALKEVATSPSRFALSR